MAILVRAPVFAGVRSLVAALNPTTLDTRGNTQKHQYFVYYGSEDTGYVCAPRHAILQSAELGPSARAVLPKWSIDTEQPLPNGVRENQVEVVRSALRSIAVNDGAVFLKLPCGRGKTPMGLFLIEYIQRHAQGLRTGNAMVFMPTMDILTQWVETARAFYPDAKIVEWEGSGKHATVASQHKETIFVTLPLRIKVPTSAVDIVVYDEMERLCAEKSSQHLLFVTNALVHIGLSFTPTRPDGRHKLIEHMLGVCTTARKSEGSGDLRNPLTWDIREDDDNDEEDLLQQSSMISEGNNKVIHVYLWFMHHGPTGPVPQRSAYIRGEWRLCEDYVALQKLLLLNPEAIRAVSHCAVQYVQSDPTHRLLVICPFIEVIERVCASCREIAPEVLCVAYSGKTQKISPETRILVAIVQKVTAGFDFQRRSGSTDPLSGVMPLVDFKTKENVTQIMGRPRKEQEITCIYPIFNWPTSLYRAQQREPIFADPELKCVVHSVRDLDNVMVGVHAENEEKAMKRVKRRRADSDT